MSISASTPAGEPEDVTPPEPRPARSRGGLALAIVYTLVGLVVLPFSVVLASFAPMVVGHMNSPDHPAVLPATLLLFGIPLLIVVGIVGGWIAWARRHGRAMLIWMAIPIVYGVLAITAVSALSP